MPPAERPGRRTGISGDRGQMLVRGNLADTDKGEAMRRFAHLSAAPPRERAPHFGGLVQVAVLLCVLGAASTVAAGDDPCALKAPEGRDGMLDVVFCIDKSGSMSSTVNNVTIWQLVTDALDAFVAAPESEGLGVGLQYFPIAEDTRGAYVFNSRDLCMIEHLPTMIEAGICSLKIEGRMKSIHYLAGVVKVYREALDAWYGDPKTYRVQDRWMGELSTISHRGYCTGFYFDDPEQIMPQYSAPTAGEYQLVGNVIGATMDGKTLVEVRNRIRRGDSLERVNRAHPPMPVTVQDIIDDQHCRQETVHAGHRVWLDLGISPLFPKAAHCVPRSWTGPTSKALDFPTLSRLVP